MTQPRDLWNRLTPLYEEREARAVVLLLLEERFGLSMADLYCGGIDSLTEDEKAQLEQCMRRLEGAEPVQYVVGTAWFGNRQFRVNPHVLIPRPETEELCRIVARQAPAHPDILDIGTGSGCIAITLALEIPDSRVEAWDLSEEALCTARENAILLKASVAFSRTDALHPPRDTGRWDIIVSNPPYVCRSEAGQMDRHVLEHEPHTALFVDDDDPLLFYRHIARYARLALRQGGKLFFEINAEKSEETARLLTATGFCDVTTLPDPFGKPRFVHCRLP